MHKNSNNPAPLFRRAVHTRDLLSCFILRALPSSSFSITPSQNAPLITLNALRQNGSYLGNSSLSGVRSPFFRAIEEKAGGASAHPAGGGEFNSVTRRRRWRIMITYCCLSSYISARVSNSSEIIGAYEAHFPCDMLSPEGVPGELSKRQSVSSATARASVCVCVSHIIYIQGHADNCMELALRQV